MKGPRTMAGVEKALKVLALANGAEGISLAEVVRRTGFPKSSAWRLLETLRRAGYLVREGDDPRYLPSSRVRQLSSGFDERAWISEIARPALHSLCREVIFPVALATPFGAAMIIRETTDSQQSVLPDHYARGTMVPLFSSASGKLYLARCAPAAREVLREICARPEHPEHAIARDENLVAQMVRQVGAQGYAFSLRSMMTRAPGQTSTLGVPIESGDNFEGSVVIRYLDVMLTRPEALRRFLGPLRACAARIGALTERAPRAVPDRVAGGTSFGG